MKPIHERSFWVFDMDGTLTRPIFDFPQIKKLLGLPVERGILEVLGELTPARAESVRADLDGMEASLALKAQPAEGADSLLRALKKRGIRLGILTRNRRVHALSTLRVTGLLPFFDPRFIVGRDEAKPKPDPEGLLRLLDQWRADSQDAVVVGDYLFDLQAGRAAGMMTVYVDGKGLFPFRDQAHVCVRGLAELVPMGSCPLPFCPEHRS